VSGNPPAFLSEEVMKHMAKLALENATTFFAEQARMMAVDSRMRGVSGHDALMAFAEAISARNHDLYGEAGKS